MSYKKQELFTFRKYLSSPRVIGEDRIAFVLFFGVVLLCVFTFRVLCCDVRYDFRMKTMFGSSLPPVVCRRAYVLFT